MKRTLITFAILFGFLALCFVPAQAANPGPFEPYMFAGTAGHECDPATQWVWYNSNGTDGNPHNVTCINYLDGRLDTPWLNWVDCPDTGGQHLNFIRTTDPTQITCGTSGGAASACENFDTLTTWHVATTGNDTTGDGSALLPWLTIQHAIDSGIPNIVCGRYIIQLDDAADRSSQNAVLDGRVFAGGTGGGTSDPTSADWPVADGNSGITPPGYSWVEINGDPAVTSTYIIGKVGVAGGNLILRGVKVQGAGSGVGVKAAQAFVSLDGVIIDAFTTNLLCVEGSVCHVDTYDFADSDTCGGTCYNLSLTAAEFDSIELSDDSILTDYLSDGNNSDTNVVIGASKTTGGQCLETKFSRVWLRGDFQCTTTHAASNGIRALHSRLSMASFTVDGSGTANIGVDLQSSSLSGAVLGGGNWTINNFATGLSADSYSSWDALPTFAGNTANVLKVGTFTVDATTSSGTGGAPGGHTTEVQFNDAGTLGGDASFFYDKTLHSGGIASVANEEILFPFGVGARVNTAATDGDGINISVTTGVVGAGVINGLHFFAPAGAGGGTATTIRGIMVEAQQGVATNSRAIEIADQGTGATDFAIKIVGGNSDLGPNDTKVGTLSTNTNCASAGGTCGSAASGAFTIAAGATTATVSTTAVHSASRIFITENSTLGTELSVTCNTGVVRVYAISTVTNGTSFVVTSSAAPVTNPACLTYVIVN